MELDENILCEINLDDISTDIVDESAVTMKVEDALAMSETASKGDGAILRW